MRSSGPRTPQSVSPSAASELSPAYPARAPWGTAAKLRAWQAEALQEYHRRSPRDFLTVATPGAGKTTFALRIAAELLAERRVRRITVVTPTEHLKVQWAEAAARVGIQLDASFRNSQGKHGDAFDGVAVTYAQVAANPALHEARTRVQPSLVILDEVHHGGDAMSWGDAIRQAFTPATRRLSLTGTPFRSDTAAIPFVDYVPDADGIRRSRADYAYSYGDALRDNVVRPVIFLSYSGNMRWRTKAGDEVSARLGEPLTKDMIAQAWRTALDPHGDWISAVLNAADRRLSELRRAMPDAGGLVIASDQADARGYADQLYTITGQRPVVVLSDESGASERIEQFASGTDRWMVAVRMVSEGVDVPRLAVGVYATATATPLFFAQAVGRFVRARRRGETASVFLPSVPQLLALAATLEMERDHALDRHSRVEQIPEELEFAAAAAERSTPTETGPGFAALDSTASFDHVLFDGAQFGTGGDIGSAEEQDFLGLPGLLDADQVATLLRERQQKQVVKAAPDRAATHRRHQELRKELSQLVAAWARKSGKPHGVIHAELRDRCGGPEVPRASLEQIEARIAVLRGWFVGRK